MQYKICKKYAQICKLDICNISSNMPKYAKKNMHIHEKNHTHKYAHNMQKICKTRYALTFIFRTCINMHFICRHTHYMLEYA